MARSIMGIFRDIPIRRKLMLITMVGNCLALLLACSAFVIYEQVTYRKNLSEEMQTTAAIIGDNCAPSLSSGDLASAGDALQSLRHQTFITAAAVYDSEGELFAQYQRPGTAEANIPLAANSDFHGFDRRNAEWFDGIRLDGERIGTIYIRHSMEELQMLQRNYMLIAAGILLVVSVISWLVSSRLQRVISVPVASLAGVVARVADRKDYSVRAVKQSEDELGRLIDGFNEMIHQIQQRDAALEHAGKELEHRIAERTAELVDSVSMLNATLESTADGILAVSFSRDEVSHNSKFATMWRIPKEVEERGDHAELLAVATSQLKHPESFNRKLEKLFLSGVSEPSEMIEFLDGRVFERHSMPQRVEGRNVGMVFNFRDVTARIRTEAILRDSENFLHSALNALSAHIAILDERGIIVKTNAAWVRFARENGYRGDRYGLGDCYIDVCDSSTGDFAEEGSVVALGIRSVMAGVTGEFQMEYPCHSPTEQRWFVVRATRFEGEGPVRVVVAHENVTARVLAEAEQLAARLNAESLSRSLMERTSELEREMAVRIRSEEALQVTLDQLASARDAALESSRQKSQFLANMSHEIRTPMNGVIGMGELLLLTHIDREQREYVDAIRSSADHLLDIINDILDSSKIDSGQMKFENIRFELRHLVESTLDVVSPAARRKGLELAGCVPPDGCNVLCGDPGRLKQVLTNLLGNAVKFTESGEVSLTVTAIEESPESVLLKFAIRDTGIGIDAAAHERIFEPFHQADGSNARKHGGTGLGLTICRQIIEAIGGELGVNSEPGVGSEFWFTIRFKKSAVSSEPVADVLGNLPILVVDDNATNRGILRRQLTNLRMRPVTVAGGQEALDFLRSAAIEGAPVPLAIVDMQMPGMDGITLAKLIKSDPLIAATRLIMLSSLGDHLSDGELSEAGVERYIVKPVKQTRLHEALVAMLSGGLESDSKQVSVPANAPRHSVRILLAEDNPINQRVALLQLKRLGYSADLAVNGHEALAALERVPYEIILMDCQMPGMDGFEATRRIRELYQRPIHIIAMTANAMAGDREKCLEAGMNEHLGKPVHMEGLERILGEWSPPTDDTPPVNLARLVEITGTDSALFRRIAEDYLAQAGEILALLDDAIGRQDAPEILRLSHKLGGSSATCGIIALVEPLSQLEHMGEPFQPTLARALHQQASTGLLNARRFLSSHMLSPTQDS